MNGIDSIVKAGNWEEVVRTMKEAPDFGIHGVKYRNLPGIVRDIEAGKPVACHYFFVGKNERNLSDNDFYEKLWASVNIALGHSALHSIKDGKAVFNDNPCILLGIDKENSRIMSAEQSPISCSYGSSEDSAKTFPVGHNFIPPVEIRIVAMFAGQIAKINRRLRIFYEQYSSDPRINMALSYLAGREATDAALKEVYGLVRQESE